MPCGPTCACLAEPGVECLGVVDPDRFGYFRDWCRLDESTEENRARRRHVLGRSRIGVDPATVPAGAGTDQAMPSPAPSLPLAGDLVAAATARLGIDRLAKYVAGQLGADCGCESRRVKLNQLDARLRRWLGMG